MTRRALQRQVPRIPPELDLTSECMDPKKILKANNIQLPFPNAKTYNNLAEYYSRTFLQKNDNKKPEKEIPQERNYAWYYSTIGYDPSYGNEYYGKLNKQFNNRKRRRKGKKSAHTSVIPCEPMRSQKVVHVKSEYKVYCRRKFPKWFKEFFSSYEASLDLDPKPRISLDEFVVRVMESSHIEGTSTPIPLNRVRRPRLTNTNRNVLLKFDANTDPLSFLKCIIFGKVDIDRPLAINVERNNEKPSCDLPLPLFAQSSGFVPDENVFLCIDNGSANKIDSSAYETESSGYMSDCSEIDGTTRRLKTLYASRYCARNSIKSKNASRLSKQTEISDSKSVLNAKENSPALESLSAEDTPVPVVENAKDSEKISIIVSIDRKWITLKNREVKNAENPQLKENKLPVGCRCNTKISKEMSYLCACGFYNNAVNEMRKFKIPRKRTIINLTSNNKFSKRERTN